MIHIIIHLFPHELDDYKRIVSEIKISSDFVKIIVSLNLNTKIVKIDKPNFDVISEFNNINQTSKLKIESSIEYDESFFGVNEHRRACIKKASTDDYLIFLDADLHFNTNILKYITKYINEINEDYFILTPQIVKYKDPSWDILVNKQYINKDYDFYKQINLSELKLTKSKPYISKIKSFKWAGGWFTTISSKLAKLIGIPKSFKGYGPDDTFMMYCCNYMKRFDINVNQYIMNNVIVCEDYSSSLNSQKYIKNNNFRAICNAHINYEYNFFKKKIDSYIHGNNKNESN